MQSTGELLTAIAAACNKSDMNGILAFLRLDGDWPNGMKAGRVHEDPQSVVEVEQVVRDLSGNILKDQMVQPVYSFRETDRLPKTVSN